MVANIVWRYRFDFSKIKELSQHEHLERLADYFLQVT
jgi:hypothetical protein